MSGAIVVTRPEPVAVLPGVSVALDASGVGYVTFADPNAPEWKPYVIAARVSGERYTLRSPAGIHRGLAASDLRDALDGYAILHGAGVLEAADIPDAERAGRYLDALEAAGPNVLGLPVSA